MLLRAELECLLRVVKVKHFGDKVVRHYYVVCQKVDGGGYFVYSVVNALYSELF